jgi:hypothetical protein
MTYNDLFLIDPTIEDEPIGTYGTDWLDFMQSNHPKLVEQMTVSGTLAEVARSVDERAWNYRFLLDEQYEEHYPRPTEYETVIAWARTRQFYTDSAVMREKVLIPHTAA